MTLLEKKWGKVVAIIAPSIFFSILHLPSMEKITVGSVILLLISGTLVGTMFSLLTLKSGSVMNSVIVHSLWNFFIITDLCKITPFAEDEISSIFSIVMGGNNILYCGGEFGVEASAIACFGYAVVCVLSCFIFKRDKEQ